MRRGHACQVSVQIGTFATDSDPFEVDCAAACSLKWVWCRKLPTRGFSLFVSQKCVRGTRVWRYDRRCLKGRPEQKG